MIEASIGELCEIVKGETGIMKAIPGQYPLVVTGADRKSSSTFQFDDEAVCIPLVSSTGHGHKSLNYVHYQTGKFALGTILAAVIPKDKNVLSAEFLQRYLQFNKDRVLVPLMTGAANVTLSMKNIAKVSVPIPSIEKQHNYIDLIKRIEKQQSNLNTEFGAQSSYLTQLRQAILQEAIEGKLTADWRKENPVRKGDPDYDAEALLEKIKDEKEKLAKEGKIKKQKPLDPIKPEEVPFELPEGWVWTRLDQISDVGTGATPLTTDESYYQNGTINWITSSSTGALFIDRPDKLITKKAIEETNCQIYPKNTLVIAMYGQGKTRGQISELLIPAATNQALASIQLHLDDKAHRRYIKNFFLNYYLEIRKLASGGAQPNLNLGKVKKTMIPLPSLEEQRTIVDRVEKLIFLVDELEMQVSERKEKSEQLMQAVLREAFEGKS